MPATTAPTSRSWYLVQDEHFWRRVLGIVAFVPAISLILTQIYIVIRISTTRNAGALNLDIFDLQDLTAYVTNAHHCLLSAVDQLMLDLSQDPTRSTASRAASSGSPSPGL